MEFIQRPNRKKFLLVLDDYVFVQTTSDTRYWHCINKKKCMSRLRFDKLGNITVYQKNHNHKPNRDQYVTSQLQVPPAKINPFDKTSRAEYTQKKTPDVVVKGMTFDFELELDRYSRIKYSTNIFLISFSNLRVRLHLKVYRVATTLVIGLKKMLYILTELKRSITEKRL